MARSLNDETKVKLATIAGLTLVLVTAIIGITFAAVLTDRDLALAEWLTFGGTALLAAVGGASIWSMRRHRWHLKVDHNGHDESSD